MIDRKKLADEIERANRHQIQCETDGDKAGVEAWHGYVRALRWVESQGVPAIPDPLDWEGKTSSYGRIEYRTAKQPDELVRLGGRFYELDG